MGGRYESMEIPPHPAPKLQKWLRQADVEASPTSENVKDFLEALSWEVEDDGGRIRNFDRKRFIETAYDYSEKILDRLFRECHKAGFLVELRNGDIQLCLGDRQMAFLFYRSHHQLCSGTTKKGQWCRNLGEHNPDPWSFERGVSDRCRWHREPRRKGSIVQFPVLQTE